MLPNELLAPLLESGFPFHLVLDRAGRVRAHGSSIAKLVPGLKLGDDHLEHFEIKRPIGARSLLEVIDPAVVLVTLGEGVQLRYQLVRAEQQGVLCLVGSPRALDQQRMRELGLSTADFAVHDSYPDYLLALSAKDQLLGETKALTRNLRELNGTLEQRVRSRTDELSMALQRAEAANQAKSEFLATISHELRTPLNGIAGLAHLLRSNGLDSSGSSLVSDLELCVEGLSQLVGDILDLARIESGALELERIPFEADELVRALSASVGPILMQKRLVLHVERNSPCPGRLLGDPLRLRQVLLNLLGNAIKFTAEGSVTLGIQVLESGAGSALVRFEVRDTGIGIAPEQQGLVFQSFRQADGSTTRRFGGTGLGLSISQKLVQRMGGELQLESALGRGSRFWFDVRLGLTAPAQSPPPADPVTPERLDGRLRVLVAEDNPLNQRIIAKVLEKHGVDVRLVADGEQALAAARSLSREFDLVLMDVQMPRMDGLEATRRIRLAEAASGLEPLPIVALTANTFTEDRERCLAAGMTGFMAKPIQVDELLEILARHLPACGPG